MGKTGWDTDLGDALDVGGRLVEVMETLSSVKHVMIAGSVRRQVPTVSDLDILVEMVDPEAELLQLEPLMPRIRWTPKSGSATVDGVWVEFYRAPTGCAGATLQFLTGPGDLNVYLRVKAKRRQMKLSQYGLWSVDGTTRYDSVSEDVLGQEASIFEALDVPFLSPPDRTNWKENLG